MTTAARTSAVLLATVLLAAVLLDAPSRPALGATASLSLSMPASAADGSTVGVDVAWRGPDDAPATGTVLLELRRRGLADWQTYATVDVVDGLGRVDITPRDDGDLRVRWPGDAGSAAVTSVPVTFDNVPTKDLRMRLGQYNLPGADKLSRPTQRARRAAHSIKVADLDVVTFNEMVGPGHDSSTNRPSRFARSVLKSLGSRWRLVTPTMTYNENYVAYRPDRMRVVAHYADRVVPGIGSGRHRQLTSRHVTPVLFKDVGSNQPVLVVGTHLVDRDRAGARRQAYDVGRFASALSSGYPVVVAGDMNTASRLSGLTRRGLKDARRAARHRTNGSRATYVAYDRRKPRTDASAIIDQVYVPRSWLVPRWTTVLGTKGGVFTRPRPSDHMLVWASLVGPRP